MGIPLPSSLWRLWTTLRELILVPGSFKLNGNAAVSEVYGSRFAVVRTGVGVYEVSLYGAYTSPGLLAPLVQLLSDDATKAHVLVVGVPTITSPPGLTAFTITVLENNAGAFAAADLNGARIVFGFLGLRTAVRNQ